MDLDAPASCPPHWFKLPPDKKRCWGRCVKCGLDKHFPTCLYRCSRCPNVIQRVTPVIKPNLGLVFLCDECLLVHQEADDERQGSAWEAPEEFCDGESVSRNAVQQQAV